MQHSNRILQSGYKAELTGVQNKLATESVFSNVEITSSTLNSHTELNGNLGKIKGREQIGVVLQREVFLKYECTEGA